MFSVVVACITAPAKLGSPACHTYNSWKNLVENFHDLKDLTSSESYKAPKYGCMFTKFYSRSWNNIDTFLVHITDV